MTSDIHPLHSVINPRAVAVVGASSDASKFGGRVMQFLLKHGYGGRIVPVNPNASSVLGVPAYKKPGEAKVEIDVALLAVPGQHIARALEECGTAGVRCAVIITADFAELGEDGAARQNELVRIGRRCRMRLIGPNCLGFINPALKLALTSSVALAVEPMPEGAIGLVSQSGSMMASMISYAADTGAGFTACISVGNQADLEICDFIEYFLADRSTRAICTYIEGLKDPRRFLAVAQACRLARKPLLVLKAGRSEAGAHIARSHTASLAGSAAVWEAVVRETGVLEVDDPEGMIACAHALSRFGAARRPGIAVLSPSGGTVAVTADRIAAAGLELASLTPETRTALRGFIPDPRPLNPLDVGGLAREQGVSAAAQAQALLSSDPTVGALFIVVATTPQLDDKVRAWGVRALELAVPTAILFTPGRLVDGARSSLREIGCPYTDRMDDALRVLRTAVAYGRHDGERPPAVEPPAYTAAIERCLGELPCGQLTEPEAKSLLRSAGIAVTTETLATSEDEAVSAARRLGYPVVLKAVSRELVHKSDLGAVKLGLDSDGAVRDAWRDILARVSEHLSDASMQGCLVQEMAVGGFEMILGCRWDAQFGAVVLAGTGGIFVELLKDTTLALAPLEEAAARAIVERLNCWPILQGTRGRTPLDVHAVTDALVRLSWIAHTAGSRLHELDVNPLLVRASGVLALDGRATMVETTSSDSVTA
jgi:acyl-CoA synthetase (NDP forming)